MDIVLLPRLRFDGSSWRHTRRTPITAVATEYRSADWRQWIAAGAEPVSELTHPYPRDGLPRPAHWAQFTKPAALIDGCTTRDAATAGAAPH